MKRAPVMAAAAILILLLSVVFAPLPGGAAWLSRLHDSAHGPVFGCIAVLALIALRRWTPFANLDRIVQYAIVLIAASLLGLLTEIAQIPAGRDASWSDLWRDALGAFAFLMMFSAFDDRAQADGWRRGVLLTLGLALTAYLVSPIVIAAIKYRERSAAFPVLADFARNPDRFFVWRHDVLLDFAPPPAALRKPNELSAARVRFLHAEYPGLEFHEPSPDWRSYSTLAIEIANAQSHDLHLVVRVHDAHHNQQFEDRFNRRFTVRAGERDVFRFALADIERAPQGRRMDMERIAGIVVFRADEGPAEEMYLLRLWLE